MLYQEVLCDYPFSLILVKVKGCFGSKPAIGLLEIYSNEHFAINGLQPRYLNVFLAGGYCVGLIL